jgi:hypothetical protein
MIVVETASAQFIRELDRRRPTRRRGTTSADHGATEAKCALAHYTSADGSAREVLALEGAAGSVLVVDRDASSARDTRLVAQLAADEPPANASIACESYVRRATEEVIRCRRIEPEDFSAAGEFAPAQPRIAHGTVDPEIRDRHGRVYSLDLLDAGMSIPELRWRRRAAGVRAGAVRTVSVRETIACVEAYEPLRALTHRALVACAERDDVSVAVLRLELERVLRSPIVLNRKLRETVLAVSREQDLSMSEIAIRCGRVKRDRAGNISGETSWLARRLGLLPEGGRDAPTPWIHTDVLAIIARRGLGVSPREVEPD